MVSAVVFAAEARVPEMAASGRERFVPDAEAGISEARAAWVGGLVRVASLEVGLEDRGGRTGEGGMKDKWWGKETYPSSTPQSRHCKPTA